MVTVDGASVELVKAEIRNLNHFTITKAIPIRSQTLRRRFAGDRGAQGAETSLRF